MCVYESTSLKYSRIGMYRGAYKNLDFCGGANKRRNLWYQVGSFRTGSYLTRACNCWKLLLRRSLFVLSSPICARLILCIFACTWVDIITRICSRSVIAGHIRQKSTSITKQNSVEDSLIFNTAYSS
jgi:hypothetical protein